MVGGADHQNLPNAAGVTWYYTLTPHHPSPHPTPPQSPSAFPLTPAISPLDVVQLHPMQPRTAGQLCLGQPAPFPDHLHRIFPADDAIEDGQWHAFPRLGLCGVIGGKIGQHLAVCNQPVLLCLTVRNHAHSTMRRARACTHRAAPLAPPRILPRCPANPRSATHRSALSGRIKVNSSQMSSANPLTPNNLPPVPQWASPKSLPRLSKACIAPRWPDVSQNQEEMPRCPHPVAGWVFRPRRVRHETE